MKKIIAMFAIVAVLALTLGASAAQTVVSRGKSYDLVTQPGDGYPDTEAKLLTDGKSGIEDKNGFFYTSDAYVGFPAANVNDEGNFVIILDLGEVMENLTEFDVGYLNETNPRIYAPTKVTVSVSSTARNGEYTTVATKDIDEPTDDGQSKAGVVNLKLEQPTSAQYVKFEITRRAKFTNGEGLEIDPNWVFLDEISVYQGARIDDETTTPDSSDETSVDSSDTTESLPQTGDAGIVAYGLLGVVAIVTMIALVGVYKRKTEN